jgi:hypothetical protein
MTAPGGWLELEEPPVFTKVNIFLNFLNLDNFFFWYSYICCILGMNHRSTVVFAYNLEAGVCSSVADP